jgi:flagellar hook-associated protein 1 FlgK
MSLFSAIQLGNNALRAQQIGLQVTGQNIANANTPGYIREEVVFTPNRTQKIGNLLLGLGVEVTGVIQKIDKFLENRLRLAGSDRASSEAQVQTLSQLEELVGELSETDLSTSLNNFFSSISDVLNQPESASVRNLAVLQGKTLAGDIVRLSNRTRNLRSDVNQQIVNAAADINQLVEEVRRLNVKITETEAAEVTHSDAVGLRDQRGLALARLAELIDIEVVEEASGSVNVFSAGDFLVFQGISRQVEVELSDDRGLAIGTIQLTDSKSPLDISAGKLAGLTTARDDVLGTFLDQLDDLARTLAFEFNKVYSSGQGLRGFTQLTSEFFVDDPNAALDATGLSYTPVNGTFQVQLFDRKTELTKTFDIGVTLTGLGNDTTLNQLAAALDAIDGIAASVTPTRQLQIAAEGAGQEIAFANDTSGILAALGLNTFFSGTSAVNLAVKDTLLADPSTFAASRDGIGEGTGNAVLLADFLDRPLESQSGASLGELYDRLHNRVTQQASVANAVFEGFRVFEESLNGQHLAISGVSLDEEAVKLITYQRAYQAAARYIATMSELLELLVNL